MIAALTHEIAKREERIAQQEREIERLMNICSEQADELARLGRQCSPPRAIPQVPSWVVTLHPTPK